MPPRRARIFAAALVAAAATGLPQPRAAVAQDVRVGRPYRVADSGVARRHVEDYERHRAAGRWEQAVAALDRLLAISPELGLVMQLDDSGPVRFEGVGRRALRLFDALPPEGVAAWEASFREDAEALLARGLRLRRPADLTAATRRYPARDVRVRGHEALASLALARGDFAAATHELRALLPLVTDDAQHAGVLARLAFARAQVGDRDGVERARLLAAPLTAQIVPGPEGGEPLGDFLVRMARAAGAGSGSGMGRPQFGGDAHGTALSAAPPAPGEKPRWQLAIGYQEGVETDRNRPFAFAARRAPRSRPVAPVVSRGVVYVNNGLQLRAVDLSSGRVIWQRGTRQRAALWRDNKLAVNTAAVEGERVYAALASRTDAPDMVRKFFERIIVYRLPPRTLASYDSRSGDLVWSHADEHLSENPDAAEISRESVASAPLVVGDDVLVATWSYDSSFDVRLVCFDRRTGRTRWRRSLAQGQQELNLFGRPVKELTTTALAELDGIVYLATGLGVAAAVDIADGSVEWLCAYPQTPIPPSNFWYETRERAVTWWPSPVTATRQAVLMAPVESPYLLSFDPRSGRMQWRVPHSRAPFDHDYFLGVAGDRAFILGDRLTAFDLADGRRIWNSQAAGRVLDLEQVETAATGAGVLTKDAVFVPTVDSIQRISTADGSTEEQWPLPDAGARSPGANLLSADGALLLVSRRGVAAHYRFEDRRDRLLALIAAEPDNPRLRLEAGEIFRRANRADDAISSFDIGLRLLDDLAPQARDGLEIPLRSALFAAYMARAADARRAGDMPGAATDLRRAAAITSNRGDAVRALFMLDDVAPVHEARAALVRVRDEFGDVQVTLDGLGRVHAGALAAIRLGGRDLAAGNVAAAVRTWLDVLERYPAADLGRTDVRGAVATRIELARQRFGDEVTTLVRQRARRALDAARAAADPQALDRVARTYPDPRTQADAALLAAKLHVNHDDARAAVAILRWILAVEIDPGDAADALWRLADAYRTLGEAAAERMTLQRLGRDHGTGEIAGRPIATLVAERLAEPRLAAPRADLPYPRPPLGLLWDTGSTSSAPQLVALTGRTPAALDGRLLAMRASVMELLDATTGRPLWRMPTDLDWRQVIGAGESLVVVGGARGAGRTDVVVRAFAAADGAPGWSRRLSGSFRAAARGLGVLYVVHATREPGGGATFALSVVDLTSGAVLASRGFDGALFPDVVVAEDAVVVFGSGSSAREPPRTVLTLDGTTLALRGTTPLADVAFDSVAVHPPGSGVVVTLSDASTLVAVGVGSGSETWRRHIPNAEVKSFHAVAGGVVVSVEVSETADRTTDRIVFLDAESGAPTWSVDLSKDGPLGWQGLAVADGTVIATIVRPDAARRAVAIAFSAADGTELWRTPIELSKGSTAHPHPVICRDVIAYEVNERLGRKKYRSRVVLLDRGDGWEAGVIAHPSIGVLWQRVVYDRGYIAVTVPGQLAVYGTR